MIAALAIGFFLTMGVYYGLYMTSLNVTLTQSWLLLGGIGVMLVIVIILVAMGWDQEIARCSTIWSLTAVMAFGMLASAWNMGIRQPNHPPDLWSSGTYIAQARTLQHTPPEAA